MTATLLFGPLGAGLATGSIGVGLATALIGVGLATAWLFELEVGDIDFKKPHPDSPDSKMAVTASRAFFNKELLRSMISKVQTS